MNTRAEPLVVVVTGPPASGKTTIGSRVAADLAIPFICRDTIKELLFDNLGWRDRDWSRRLGGASWELFYYVIELQIAGGSSCVVESNFQAELAAERFQRLRLRLRQRRRFRAAELLCVANDEVLLGRYMARAASGSRHPGHVDHANRDELLTRLRERHDYSLGLDGMRMTIDTTDLDSVDYAGIADALRSA